MSLVKLGVVAASRSSFPFLSRLRISVTYIFVPQPFFRSAVPRVVVAPGTFVTVSGQRLDSIQAASFGPRSTIEVSLLTIESSMIIIKLGNILRNGNFSLQYSLDGQLFSTSNLSISVEQTANYNLTLAPPSTTDSVSSNSSHIQLPKIISSFPSKIVVGVSFEILMILDERLNCSEHLACIVGNIKIHRFPVACSNDQLSVTCKLFLIASGNFSVSLFSFETHSLLTSNSVFISSHYAIVSVQPTVFVSGSEVLLLISCDYLQPEYAQIGAFASVVPVHRLNSSASVVACLFLNQMCTPYHFDIRSPTSGIFPPRLCRLFKCLLCLMFTLLAQSFRNRVKLMSKEQISQIVCR